MRTIDIATCCFASLLIAGCDPDPDPQSPDAGQVIEDGGQPPPPPVGPRSCAAIKAANPTAANGSHTIFIGEPAQPVEIYCDDMGTPEPKEYLELTSTSDGSNTSVLYLNGSGVSADQTALYTTFRRVRLLLEPTAIDLGDTRWTTVRTTGPAGPISSPLLSDLPIDRVAFGVTILCRTQSGGTVLDTAQVAAQIDLSGTRFILDAEGPQVGSMFRQSSQDAHIDGASPQSVTLTPYRHMSDNGCNFVAPAGLRWPPVNPTPGSVGTLPLRLLPG